MTDPITDPAADGAEDAPPPPDYSRLGFRDLQKLCKARELSAEGKTVDLIERLQAYDAQHGRAVDTTLPDDDEPDLLDDDTDDGPPLAASTPPQTPTAQTSPGGGEAASTPPPDGHPAHPVAAEGSAGLPPATVRGKPNLAARNGVVRVGEGHGGEVRAYRREFTIGGHELSDSDHFRFIEDTHAAATREGLATKGGTTIGQRIGYATDTDGRRTVIYQVSLKRQR